MSLFLRFDIVLNCRRRKKDIQCVSVQKCNDEMYSSKLRYHMIGSVSYFHLHGVYYKENNSHISFPYSCQTDHELHLEKLLKDKSKKCYSSQN